ncbi:MAG TPA: hypothetical protein VHQ42_04180 [Candidatus Limnocylindria bacterium]|nr:hypothetical protein [Candidatus Limnocylindria bacterium]
MPAILVWALVIVAAIVLFDILFVGVRVLATRARPIERSRQVTRR